MVVGFKLQKTSSDLKLHRKSVTAEMEKGHHDQEVKRNFAKFTQEETHEYPRSSISRLSKEKSSKVSSKFFQHKTISEEWNDLDEVGLNNLLKQFYGRSFQLFSCSKCNQVIQ